MRQGELRDRIIVLSIIVLLVCVVIAWERPQTFDWAFRTGRPPAPEVIDEAKFAQMTPAQHLAEWRRLQAKGDFSSSSRHLDAIPKDAEERKQVVAFYQELIKRIEQLPELKKK